MSDPDDQLHMVRQRSLPEHNASYSIDMTQAEYEAFASWYLTDCNGGNECFTSDWLDDGGFAYHFARFRGAGYTASRHGVRWTVTIELEIIAKITGSPFRPAEQPAPVNYGNITMPEIELSTSTSG